MSGTEAKRIAPADVAAVLVAVAAVWRVLGAAAVCELVAAPLPPHALSAVAAASAPTIIAARVMSPKRTLVAVPGDEAAAAQDRITAFWNAVSDAYESDPGNVPAAASPEAAAWSAAIAEALPAAPSDVLDVGCGTGFVAGVAAAAGHRVTAIDLSPAMIEVARRLTPAARFSVDDAVGPAFAPASFDAVVNRSLLWTLREPGRALAAWHALLRAGGRLACFYGLSATPRGTTPAEPERASFFDRHYTPETRARLPCLEMSDHAPLLALVGAAGFGEPVVRELRDVGRPHYVLTAVA